MYISIYLYVVDFGDHVPEPENTTPTKTVVFVHLF